MDLYSSPPILSSSTTAPAIHEYEVERQDARVKIDLATLVANRNHRTSCGGLPEAIIFHRLPSPLLSTVLIDDLHRVAFRSGRLARPILVPVSRIGKVNRDAVIAFRNKHFVGSNVVVAGYGEKEGCNDFLF